MWRIAGCLLMMTLIPLSGCSSMLVGGGSSSSPAIGEDRRDAGAREKDEALALSVMHAFSRDTVLKSGNISAVARSGVVTLSGSVADFETRDRAVRVARNTTGVVRVNKQIEVNSRR